jgi:hypothetical protein
MFFILFLCTLVQSLYINNINTTITCNDTEITSTLPTTTSTTTEPTTTTSTTTEPTTTTSTTTEPTTTSTTTEPTTTSTTTEPTTTSTTTEPTTTSTTTEPPPPPSDVMCESFGILQAKDTGNGKCSLEPVLDIQFDKFLCSPEITSSTNAVMSWNDFAEGGSGGWPSYCDGIYHSNTENVIALSTGWFDNLSNCGREIEITIDGKTARGIVVDECDSRLGCDPEHAFLPPCKNNIIDTSRAIWDELGLDTNVGLFDVEWRFT